MDTQRGFALAAALMILALLSVLGAAAIQSTTIEVQLSAHDRDARAALYVAEAGLSEARYYASRGWGKVTRQAADRVVVETALAPGLLWEANLYRDFTLVDQLGASFRVLSHTDASAPPELTLDVPADPPAEGRFTLVRSIPIALWAAPNLEVDDGGWASRSGADTWLGWTLWNASGKGFAVTASTTGLATAGPGQAVFLQLTTDPGVGPFTLSQNPWLRALAAGASLPGDADAAALGWGRRFYRDASHADELGSAVVTAEAGGPGEFRLAAQGTAGQGTSLVTLRVRRAGLPDQRARDWTVE